MILGFTGTRYGMTDDQRREFVRWIASSRSVAQFHHGDCIGADADAANLVRNGSRIAIHKRPCTMREMQAHTDFDVEYPEKTPFARNRDIVDAADVLLACPYTMQEEQRGGTWYTIHYAWKKFKRTVIFWPDGSVTDHPAIEPAAP